MTDSPASKVLAASLAKYAFVSAASPSRLSIVRPSPQSAEPPAAVRLPSRPRRRARVDYDERSDGEVAEDDAVDNISAAENSQQGSQETKPARSPKPKPPKKPRGFASPEVYKHLRPVQDILEYDLDRKMSATTGHHFGHPTNKFWRALHLSGMTDRLLAPAEDRLMPSFGYGMTNLVDRPTAEQSELSTLEMRLAVPAFARKIAKYRPRLVCFVGKKIWDTFEDVAGRAAGGSGTSGAEEAGEGASRSIEQGTAGAAARDDEGSVKLESARNDEVMVKLEPAHDADAMVKVEPADSGATVAEDGIDVKLEAGPDLKPEVLGELRTADAGATPTVSEPTASPARARARAGTPRSRPGTPRARARAPAAAFDWTRPRALRIPHAQGHTYFWVVPNTSGLERTPLEQQVVLFSHLRAFSARLRAGERLDGPFADIYLDGVDAAADAIRAAAVKRSVRVIQ
ncbi:uracil DNA N-glycosylase Thp1 [Cryptotrichosporon argae]